MEEKILNLLTQPMKTGEVAEATGIEKKEVEKIIKKLVSRLWHRSLLYQFFC